jgi:hypothetical protein
MTPAIQAALDELKAAQGPLDEVIEGFADFARVNVSSAARLVVEQAMRIRTRRAECIRIAIQSLESLDRDGYPDIPKVTVAHDVRDDLADQARTMAAALGEVVEEGPAENLNLDGKVEPRTI